MLPEPSRPVLVEAVEEAGYVGVQDPVHLAVGDRHRERVQRVVLAASRSEAVAEPEEVLLVDLVRHRAHGLLDDSVLQRRDPQCSIPRVDRSWRSTRGMELLCHLDVGSNPIRMDWIAPGARAVPSGFAITCRRLGGAR